MTANFNTDPSSIGRSKDFIVQIGETTRKSVARMLGPDPLNCFIGPAISVARVAGAYMDLIYAGNTPETPLARRAATSSDATTMKGGRGRTLEEWRDIWAVIGDWVYENEATLISSFGGSYTFKYRLSDEENAEHSARRFLGNASKPTPSMGPMPSAVCLTSLPLT